MQICAFISVFATQYALQVTKMAIEIRMRRSAKGSPFKGSIEIHWANEDSKYEAKKEEMTHQDEIGPKVHSHTRYFVQVVMCGCIRVHIHLYTYACM
jgi:hypothetical protein